MIIKCYKLEKAIICSHCKQRQNCTLGVIDVENPNRCKCGMTWIDWEIIHKKAWKIVGEPFPKYGWTIFADNEEEAIKIFMEQDELYSGQEINAYRWPERDDANVGSFLMEEYL